MSEHDKDREDISSTEDEDEAGSAAFDQLAYGEDAPLNEPIQQTPSPSDAPATENVAPPEEIIAAEMEEPIPAQDFTSSFEENYEADTSLDSTFDAYDDFYDEDLDDEAAFDEDVGFDDSDIDVEDAIDAEFSEFDASETETGNADEESFDDDWDANNDDGGFFDDEDTIVPEKGKKKSSSGNASAAGGMLSSPLIKYGAIAGIALLVLGGGYMVMGGGNKPAPQSQKTAGKAPSKDGGNPSASNPGEVVQQGEAPVLSAILNTGKLDNQDSSSMLDDLDNIDALEKKGNVQSNTVMPIFTEKKSLSTLAAKMPEPTPIINEELPAQSSQNAIAQPVPSVDQMPLSEEVTSLSKETVPQPFTQENSASTTPPAEMGFATPEVIETPFAPVDFGQIDTVRNDLKSIESQAKSETQNQPSREVKQENFVKQTTVSPVQSQQLAQSLKDNVSKFEEQTGAFVDRIKAIENKVNTMPDQNEVSALSEKIDALNNKISQLEKELKTTKSNNRVAAASAPKATPSRDKAASAEPKKTIPLKASAKSGVSAVKWQLRAASPGQAWVSKLGDKELKQIGVGDKLAGIGTVKDITIQSGRWKVIGSEGTILQ